MSKLLLGKDLYNENIYLTKHTWDCDWYWGFGYLGNKDCHYHFESYLDGKHWSPSDVFSNTKITDKQWYVILELFKQVYNLKEAYEAYYRGGAHITTIDIGITQDKDMALRIKDDMEKILNTVWEYINDLDI